MEPADALEVVERLPSDATDARCVAAVDLVLSGDATPGIRRVRRGQGFSYHRPDGTLLEGPGRERCVQLAVPPAWTDVWSGIAQEHVLWDRRLVRQLQRMAGAGQPQLFAWSNGDGGWHDVRGEDVNRHLRELACHEVSAKDFRTWGGTVRALAVLDRLQPADDEHQLEAQRRAAVDAAADALGNTRAVARASYVHPTVLDAHGTGAIAEVYDDDPGVVEHLGPLERALLRLLGTGGVTPTN